MAAPGAAEVITQAGDVDASVPWQANPSGRPHADEDAQLDEGGLTKAQVSRNRSPHCRQRCGWMQLLCARAF